MKERSPLHQARLKAPVEVPKILEKVGAIEVKKGEATSAVSDAKALEELFPKTFGQPQVHLAPGSGKKLDKGLRVGVVLSGGQAPGGHNVIAGLFDALKELHSESQLFGFTGGPSGIINNETLEITSDLLSEYRNLGGFDIIGSGRTKIESNEQLAASLKTAQTLQLDGLVVVGGDDSNTNAALLAEYFLDNGCTTGVIGVPKTIDGDLKNEQIEISFGHDTACRVYAELVGNLMRDCLSAKKYYHFVRLMGRSASHITLECALQTQPNLAILGEEVEAQNKTLRQITSEIADLVRMRAKQGKHFGVILIPEGLIEFIPEVKVLISELNALLPQGKTTDDLSPAAKSCFDSLPEKIQQQLLLDRDPHGNVQVSRIETEQLLIEMVAAELTDTKFSAIHHFFGYEGRSAMPTPFDCQYCYGLGKVAAVLIRAGLTGYMSSLRELALPVEEWVAGGIPITMMMNMEERHGKPKPVIQKALADLQGAPFQTFAKHRDQWASGDCYEYPGPIQFFGDRTITDQLPETLSLEHACPVM